MVRETFVRKLMLMAMFSRLLVFGAAILAASVFDTSCNKCWDLGVPFLNLFSRWDSGHYSDIATHGYSSTIVENWEFFPGYPSMMAAVGWVVNVMTHLQPLVAVSLAGFVISNAAFFGAVYAFYKLSCTVLDPALAYEAALFLALYPAGVFLSSVYSESLFLMLTIGSLYYWRVKSFGKSGFLGFLSAITRPVGIFLIVPYVYSAVAGSSKRDQQKAILQIACVLSGYLTFMAFSQIMTGTPFANFVAENLYWRVDSNIIAKIVAAYEEVIANPIILPFIILSFLTLATSTINIRSKTEAAILLYGVCLLGVYLLNPIDSFPRYSITLLPMFWILARWSQRLAVKIFIIVLFVALLLVGTGLFVNWANFY